MLANWIYKTDLSALNVKYTLKNNQAEEAEKTIVYFTNLIVYPNQNRYKDVFLTIADVLSK